MLSRRTGFICFTGQVSSTKYTIVFFLMLRSLDVICGYTDVGRCNGPVCCVLEDEMFCGIPCLEKSVPLAGHYKLVHSFLCLDSCQVKGR